MSWEATHSAVIVGAAGSMGKVISERLQRAGLEVSELGRLSNRVVSAPAPRSAVGHQPTELTGFAVSPSAMTAAAAERQGERLAHVLRLPERQVVVYALRGGGRFRML